MKITLIAKWIVSLALITVVLAGVLPVPASAAYELRLHSTTTGSATTSSSKVKVYEKQGTAYVPLHDIVKQLGYSFTGTIEDELFTYHKYTVIYNGQAAIFWGNDDNGYQIETYALSKGNSLDNKKIYEPPMHCQQESDICELITSKYKGPIVHDGTLYVPVRQLAEALALDLKVSKSAGTSVISLMVSKQSIK